MRVSKSLIPLNVLFKAIVTEKMEGFYRVGKEKSGAVAGAVRITFRRQALSELRQRWATAVVRVIMRDRL
ncbi:MAG: hypothetical protein CMN76_12950 [Spirochaetaceae bacterium]|nr:hypothetical protein [Spirochaetaceae bacterium]|tara:strand:- start:2223 stop:2432 length:210 start_codon:yes stop_codon:yes gene_type:complete